MEPIGRVEARRTDAEDDTWGAEHSRVVLEERFRAEALDGIEDFSHVEILFFFDRVDPAEIVTGARHPGGNPQWPAAGIFAQRGKNRPNRIGSTMCRMLGRDGRTLTVEGLDPIDGTPVLDIKPVMQEFLPREDVRQPAWSHQLTRGYWG